MPSVDDYRLLTAARRVAADLSEAVGDNATALNCGEAEVWAEFLRAAGYDHAAEDFLKYHGRTVR